MANLSSTFLNNGQVQKSATEGQGGAISGTTLSVDLSKANFFHLDLQSASGNIDTFTITNVKSGYVNSFVLKLIQRSSGGWQFNWVSLSAFKWPDGSAAPTLTGTTDAVDILSFTTYDNGTTWYGSLVGVDFQ
jgi:hypothetical protein